MSFPSVAEHSQTSVLRFANQSCLQLTTEGGNVPIHSLVLIIHVTAVFVLCSVLCVEGLSRPLARSLNFRGGSAMDRASA